jgi:hypothetical protein
MGAQRPLRRRTGAAPRRGEQRVEVLKDKGPVSDDAHELIDRWMNQTRRAGLGLQEEQSLLGQLGRLKTASISQGIRSLTQRHLGDEAAQNVVKLYACRSKLVHDGVTLDDLRTTLTQAETLIRQVLAKILSTGTR